MNRFSILVTSLIFSAGLAMPVAATTEQDALDLLNAQRIALEAALAVAETKQEEKQIEVALRQTIRLYDKIYDGKVKDIHKLLENSPWVMSPA